MRIRGEELWHIVFVHLLNTWQTFSALVFWWRGFLFFLDDGVWSLAIDTWIHDIDMFMDVRTWHFKMVKRSAAPHGMEEESTYHWREEVAPKQKHPSVLSRIEQHLYCFFICQCSRYIFIQALSTQFRRGVFSLGQKA